MTWVHRIDGAPGAGKTHTLLNKIQQERADGVRAEDMQFLTFTNAARKDARLEISRRFDDLTRHDADDMVYTIHGAALGAVSERGLIDKDDTIIQPGDDPYYRMFAEQHGMNYAGRSVRDVEEGKEIEGNGDVFFALNSWLVSTYRGASDVRRAPIEYPWLSIDTFRELQAEWEDYKQTAEPEFELWEHHDYLETAIEQHAYPTAEVIFIDEFQDFSPLQYKYYKELRDNGPVKRMYIAGDPHQSIYSFRGADPYYFHNTDHDDATVLNETRRCRDEIATLARRLLESSDANDSRAFTATQSGGTARMVRGDAATVQGAIDAATAAETDSLMLLARTNTHWRRLARFLRKRGYPYQVLGTRGWSMWDIEENHNLLQALHQLQAADAVAPKALNTLLDTLPESHYAANRVDSLAPTADAGFPAETVRGLFDAPPSELVDHLPIKESYRTAIAAALERDGMNDRRQIRVGTIHASKGLEADTVLLFPAYSRTMQDRYAMDQSVRAEEHRVAYVAATRARDRLYVVRDFFNKAPMPMFERPSTREVLA